LVQSEEDCAAQPQAFSQNHFPSLAEIMLEELKLLANKRDVPYQSIIKIILSERIEKEIKP